MSLFPIILLMTSQSVAATVPLQPSGKWVVDYAEDMCTLSRTFGPDNIVFGLRPDGFGGGSALAVVMVPGARQTKFFEFRGEIGFKSGEKGQAVDVESYWLNDRKTRVVTFRVDHATLNRMTEAGSFSVPVGARDEIHLAPNQMPEARRALDDCTDNLMESFGVPLVELKRATVRPRFQDAQQWFSSLNYPVDARSRGMEGRTVALIEVSAEGKPAECRVISNDSHEGFTEATCGRVMREGRFDPARNAHGEAIRSWTTMSVNWEIER